MLRNPFEVALLYPLNSKLYFCWQLLNILPQTIQSHLVWMKKKLCKIHSRLDEKRFWINRSSFMKQKSTRN